MKYVMTLTTLMVFSIFYGCLPEALYNTPLGPDDGGLVYLTQAGQGPVANLSIFPPQDFSTQTINACFGGLGFPKDDIKVQFEIDQHAIDSVNNSRVTQHLTPYTIYPAESFSIDKMSVTIPAGEVNSSGLITFKYFPKLLSTSEDYIMALRIKDVSGGYKINNQVRSLFLRTLKLTPKQVDKSFLSATADSEELNGEGPVNGHIAAAIDTDVNTFWHTAWQNSHPPYPHWILLDMGSVRYIPKIGLIRRKGVPGFNKFDLEASEDGMTWIILLKDYARNTNTDEEQTFQFAATKCKYLKLTMTQDASGAAHTTLAEFIPYELK